MNDVFLEYTNFPLTINGMVLPVFDFDFVILINDAFTLEKQKEIYDHEMRHIKLGHYNDLKEPITLIEEQANDITLLNKEIEQAAICGISTPLLPKREINSWEYEVLAINPNYRPTYTDIDPLEMLNTVLLNLEDLRKEVDAYLEEKRNMAL